MQFVKSIAILCLIVCFNGFGMNTDISTFKTKNGILKQNKMATSNKTKKVLFNFNPTFKKIPSRASITTQLEKELKNQTFDNDEKTYAYVRLADFYYTQGNDQKMHSYAQEAINLNCLDGYTNSKMLYYQAKLYNKKKSAFFKEDISERIASYKKILEHGTTTHYAEKAAQKINMLEKEINMDWCTIL